MKNLQFARARRRRRWSLAAILVIQSVMAFSTLSAQVPAPPAPVGTVVTVWRDEWGVPHIESPDEEAAWYALGYEQAKDALPQIQATVKKIRGQAVKYLNVGFDGRNVVNDMVVKMFDTYLVNRTDAQINTMLSPSPGTGITANLWTNCKAMARGVNDYRLQVKAATGTTTPEAKLKNFLVSKSMSWVFNDEVKAVDFGSWGRWTNAYFQFAIAGSRAGVRANAVDSGPANFMGGGSTAPDPQTIEFPSSDMANATMDTLRRLLAGFPGMGSNAFGWSSIHTRDAANVSWSGCMADPHNEGQFEHLGLNPNAFDAANGFDQPAMHSWFAHVKVTPQGATTPTLDVFGEISHGMPTFFTCHNRNVAYSGTLGAPNIADAFVLRLKEDTQTSNGLAVPLQYYSYYHDTNGNNGVESGDWRPLVQGSVTIERFHLALPPAQVALPFWRADSFGVVMPDMAAAAAFVVDPTLSTPTQPAFAHGEKNAFWRIRVNDPKMRYWATAQTQNGVAVTEPMTNSLRMPMDDNVAGDAHHSRLAVAFWELAHARTIWDAAANVMDHDANYSVNFIAVDREGRVMSTQLGAIPRRGNDSSLQQAGYHAFPDKWIAYTGAGGGVPARYSSDRMFDWQYANYSNPNRPTGLDYLIVGGSGGPNAVNFMPYLVWDPTTGSLFPSSGFSTQTPFRIENGGFASLCNDMAWHSSVKRESFVLNSNSLLFNNYQSPNNAMLQATLDAGTVYQTAVFGFEAVDRNALVIDRLTSQSQFAFTGGAQGTAPMTPTQAKSFAVESRLYVAEDYPGVDTAVGSGTSLDAVYPPAIRIVKEAVDRMTGPDPITTDAAKEAKFMNDLWAKLWGGTSANYTLPGTGTVVNLKSIWVDNAQNNQVFWFDNPTNTTNPGIRWIDMPPGFALIDFLWSQSEIGNGAMVAHNGQGGLSASDKTTLAGYVQTLVNWESTNVPIADRYRMNPTSPGAALYHLYRASFDAANAFGRHWVRLDNGRAAFASSTGAATLLPLQNGQLPNPPVGTTLVRQSLPWSTSRLIAFPLSHVDSLIGVNPFYTSTAGLTQPPYAALYDANGAVKTTFTPSDINEIVKFFLQLGGYYIDPARNNGDPSRKMARFSFYNGATKPDAFAAARPANFPLTRGLARVAVLRRMIDAGNFWQSLSSTGNTFGDIFRTRVFGFDGVQRWPLNANGTPNPAGAPCVGPMLRSTGSIADFTAPGFAADRGMQPRYFAIGGSFVPLLTMFPQNQTQMQPQSYFWCTPANRLMRPDDVSFTKLMPKYATNELVTSHYSDYSTAAGSTSSTLVYTP